MGQGLLHPVHTFFRHRLLPHLSVACPLQHPSPCTEHAVLRDAAEDLDTPALDLMLVPPVLLRLALPFLDPLLFRIVVLGSGVRPRFDDLGVGLGPRVGEESIGRIGPTGGLPVAWSG